MTKRYRGGQGDDKVGSGAAAPRRRARKADMRAGLDRRELIAAVCQAFCKGTPASQIRDEVSREFGIADMSREEPYRLLAHAAVSGWLQYRAPLEQALRLRVREAHPWLEDVEVVHTAVADDVAQCAARVLLGMIQRLVLQRRQAEVHVGFAGGSSMRGLALAFAPLLRQPSTNLPERIVFHSMAAGFDVFDPTMDPNSFFAYFQKDAAMITSTAFVGLQAPSLVRTSHMAELKELEGIRESYKLAGALDIIVTSASQRSDDHNRLRDYMRKAPAALARLERAGWVGDVMWRPISAEGPIEIETQIRAMTLKELSELPAFIANGKKVLLMLGPCSACHKPKTDLLKVLLAMKPPLMTHLVVDSRTARPLFGAA